MAFDLRAWRTCVLLWVIGMSSIGPAQAVTDQGTARRSALLVVDAQVGVLQHAWEADRVVRNLQRLVRRARRAGVPVIWVQHADDASLQHGSAAWQLVQGLTPAADEQIIHKRFHSAFSRTDLAQHLRTLGADHLILAGAATNWCVRATAYAALERGLHLTLAADAHTTEDLPVPHGPPIPAVSIVTEFNRVMEWLQFPEVRTAVLRAEDISFR